MPPAKKRTAAPRRVEPSTVGVVVLRVSLAHITPTIWREISVPDHYTFAQLHRVLQCAFSWLDYHLHGFRVGSQNYVPAVSEVPGKDTATTSLASLALKRGSRFVYDYDYGDGWEHEIEVVTTARESVTPGALLMPRVLGGERAAPPEDSGGAPGYQALLEALADVRHPEHRQARGWVPSGFDPSRFDLPSVDHGLVLACAWGAI